KSRVVIRQLGEANGGVVDGGISKALAVMVFLVVFVLWCVLTLLSGRFRESWRASASPSAAPLEEQPETQLTLRAPSRGHAAAEPELGDFYGKAQSAERMSEATARPEPHAHLSASGS